MTDTMRSPFVASSLTTILLITLATPLAISAEPPPTSGNMPDNISPTDCTAQLSDAESALERGRRLATQKRWQEALPELRDTGTLATSLITNCSALAAQGKRLFDVAAAEFRIAESSASHLADCQPQIDRALELDIRASTAKREGNDPANIERLLAEGEDHWRKAVDTCQSPHREKAERGLKTTIRARALNAELLSSGPACDIAWKNAGSMNELARNAWKDKHWEEAAALYDKAAMAWEVAKEKCSGSRQQQADKKIEQAQLDAHNAEHCGPQWETATEATQKLKASAASASLTERDQLSIHAEVSWRNAFTLCRGTPKSIAKTNAEALSRERGAPLPPAAMSLVNKQQATSAPLSASPVATQTRTISPSQAVPLPTVVTNSVASSTGEPLKESPATPAVTTATLEEEVVAGDTTFRGKFVVDPASGQRTGYGQVEWSNGDRYNGDLVAGQRHGSGKLTWASGQWYDGQWQNNMASGQGIIGYTNGDRYEGHVSKGLPHGRGTLRFASGDRYTGDFTQGVFNGQGTYFWKGGDRYDGGWVLGQKQGAGRFTFALGGGWEGEYRDDKRTNNGKQFAAAGSETVTPTSAVASAEPPTTIVTAKTVPQKRNPNR